MIQTKEDLKEMFEAGQVQTEAKMVDLIDSCYNETAYEVVAVLPTTIPLGKLVLYNGTLWRGLKAGESTLAEGTPFPVKGYKECSFSFWYNNPNIVLKTYVNDIGSFTLQKVGIGEYKIGNVDFAESANTEVFVNQSFLTDYGIVRANTENDEILDNGLSIIISQPDSTRIDPSPSNLRIFVEVRKYPPTT